MLRWIQIINHLFQNFSINLDFPLSSATTKRIYHGIIFLEWVFLSIHPCAVQSIVQLPLAPFLHLGPAASCCINSKLPLKLVQRIVLAGFFLCLCFHLLHNCTTTCSNTIQYLSTHIASSDSGWCTFSCKLDPCGAKYMWVSCWWVPYHNLWQQAPTVLLLSLTQVCFCHYGFWFIDYGLRSESLKRRSSVIPNSDLFPLLTSNQDAANSCSK